MGSGAIIYISSFIKIGSGNQNLIGRRSHKHISVFQNKESRLKMKKRKNINTGRQGKKMHERTEERKTIRYDITN
jgi:hypothetical protein